jgi:hypothetical protein
MAATTNILVKVATFSGNILAPKSGLKYTADVHMFLTAQVRCSELPLCSCKQCRQLIVMLC